MRCKPLSRLSFCANLLLLAMVCAGTVLMFTGAKEEASLAAVGLRALRYFTVQSNLLAGLAGLLYALALLPVLRGKTGSLAPWVQTLKLVAVASVGLTFLVVAVFFVLILHAPDMFSGANLFFHLLVPLYALVSFVLFDRFAPLKRWTILLGAVPMLLYGCFYTANCLINGVGSYDNKETLNDWYWFLHEGYAVGVLMFVILAAATLGLTALLRLGNQSLRKRSLPPQKKTAP